MGIFGGGGQVVAPTPMAARPERRKTTLDASELNFMEDPEDAIGSRKLFRPAQPVGNYGTKI